MMRAIFGAALIVASGVSAAGADMLTPGGAYTPTLVGNDVPLLERRDLTGDWFGARPWLEAHGVDVEAFYTQYLQGVVDGGDERGWAYGGRVDTTINVDGEKAGLWRGLFATAKIEGRYGQDVNEMAGALSAPNFIMAFPNDFDSIAVTGLTITQALSENFAVYAGKLNTLDQYAIRLDPELAGLPSIGGFLNTSLIWNPIIARTYPYSAAGGGFVVMKDLQPVFSLTVFDPEERADRGVERLFSNGVVIAPDATLRTRLFGLPAVFNVGGTYSTAEYTSINLDDYLGLVIANILSRRSGGSTILEIPQKQSSWAVYGNAYQALWEGPDSHSWGVFGKFGVSDGNPNPVSYSVSAGLAGFSLIQSRPDDSFGLGGFYIGLSDDFKRLTSFILPQRDEKGLEAFYTFAVTPSTRLTADAQLIEPSTQDTSTAVVLGLRLQVRL